VLKFGDEFKAYAEDRKASPPDAPALV